MTKETTKCTKCGNPLTLTLTSETEVELRTSRTLDSVGREWPLNCENCGELYYFKIVSAEEKDGNINAHVSIVQF